MVLIRFLIIEMPRSCCVPQCKANYYNGEYVPAFAFPRDESRRKVWKKKIPRDNLKITKNTVVCIKHFAEECLVRESRATRLDGSELRISRRKLALTDDAYPSIFPGYPKDLSSKSVTLHPAPDNRKQKSIELGNVRYDENECLPKDDINNLNDIMSGLSKFKHNEWTIRNTDGHLYFFKIDITGNPTLRSTVILDNDLHVQIYHNGRTLDATENVEEILGIYLKCNTFSKLEILLRRVNDMADEVTIVQDKIITAQALLQECIRENNYNNNTKDILNLIHEQLSFVCRHPV